MKEKFISYAQDYEDIILYHVLKDIKHGFYVDVGANDPWNISVTKSLYELGWNGINIEPLQDKYNELMEDRKRDINCCVIVGNKDGTVEFYQKGTGSTCDKRVVETWNTATNVILMPIKKLTDVIKDSVKDLNKDIHFCKIDVEGFEKSVLEGIDFNVIRPWIFVVESTKPGTDIPCYAEWEGILTKAGYIFAFDHGINRYYVDNKKSELKNKFSSLDELTELYDIYKCVKDNNITSSIYYKIGRIVTFPLSPLRPLIKKIWIYIKKRG